MNRNSTLKFTSLIDPIIQQIVIDTIIGLMVAISGHVIILSYTFISITGLHFLANRILDVQHQLDFGELNWSK